MRKILSLVLALALVLGSFSFAFAAQDDIDGHKYESAIRRLNALGLVIGDDRGFAPDDTITRAEFATLVVRALGYENVAKYSKGATEFVDVPADHWASGYINVASKIGLIEGYGDGNFGPSDLITYEQAITLVVRALGYRPAAEDKGGYPFGYLVIADHDLGITDDVDGVVGIGATRGVVFKLLDNALDKPMMIQTQYGDNKGYVVSGEDSTEKVTILDKIGVDKAEVVLLDIADDKVTVLEDGEEEEYELSTDVDAELLGKAVTLWLDGDKVVTVTEGSNTVKEITVANTKTVDGVNKLVDDTDDANEFDLAADAQMVFNGTRMVYDASLVKEGAEVTLIDNATVEDEETAAYEYLIVKYYEGPYVVSKDYDSDYNYVRTTDVDGHLVKVKLVLNDDDEVDTDANVVTGDADELEELVEGTVVYVAKDAASYTDATKLEILVVDDVIEGEFTEIQNDGDYIIDGDEYTPLADFDSLLGSEVEAKLGRDGKSIVDMVAVEEEDNTTTFFGFVKDAALIDGGLADDTYQVKVFTQDGEDVIFDVKADADIDGTKPEDVANDADFKALFLDTELVKYTVNEDNVIVKVETLTPDGSVAADLDSNNSGDFFTDGTNRYYVTEDTIIFNRVGTTFEVVAFEDIAIPSDDVDGKLDIDVFEAGDFDTYGVVVVTETIDTPQEEGTIAVVTDISIKGKNDAGDYLAKYYVTLVDGTETSYESELVYEDVYADAVGSIVEFTINSDDIVTAAVSAENVSDALVQAISATKIDVAGEPAYAISEDVLVFNADGTEADLADIEAHEVDEEGEVIVPGTLVSFYLNDDGEVAIIVIEGTY